MKNIIKKIKIKPTSLLIVIMATLFSSIIVVSAGNWTPPTSSVPSGNPEPPLNTSTAGQIKEGGLVVASGSGITTGFVVLNGNVGIGTMMLNPKVELHVKSLSSNADIATESVDGFSWTMSTAVGGNWILNRNIPGDLPVIIVDQNGNVGIRESKPNPNSPNSQFGNLDVNDVYLRSTGKWASQGGAVTGGSVTNKPVYGCPEVGRFDCGGCSSRDISFGSLCPYWNDAGCNNTETASCTLIGYLVAP